MSDKEIRVIGKFSSEEDAWQFIIDSDIQVLILSGEMITQSAYQFVLRLMRTKPVPCLILDDSSSEVDYPRALDYGIVDVLTPEYQNDKMISPSSLIIKVKILSKLKIERFLNQIDSINKNTSSSISGNLVRKRREKKAKAPIQRVESPVIRNQSPHKHNALIVIGASTGGPSLLAELVSLFPKSFPPVIIVQHMPSGFVGQFAKRLDKGSEMRVKKAEDGEVLIPNTVFVAPGGFHLEFSKLGSQILIKLTTGPKLNFVKPAVDATLFSASKIFGNRLVSVILSGMGSDGLEGSKQVKQSGGQVIALSEKDSLIYGMNRSVIEAGIVDHISNLNEIVLYLTRLIRI